MRATPPWPIAKRMDNELTAEAHASFGQKGKEIMDAYRRLLKKQQNRSLSRILFNWQCSVQERKEMDRIKYEVERSSLLDKTTFIDRQEQIRTKTDLMTEMEVSINMVSPQSSLSFILLNSEEDRLSDQDTND
jgi:CDP-diacylglycerol pyrophosphatase